MKKLLLKSILLLCALVVGTSAWAQSDYSATYNSDSEFSSVITGSSVTIGSTNYNAAKKGTSGTAGSITLSVPKDTKYLHLHVAAWNGETVSLSVTPAGYSDNIALTADGNIKGSGTTYDVDDDKCTSDYYKVITFTSALAANTNLTFSASTGKRFVMWGVKAEAASSDPTSNAAFTYTAPEIDYPATKTYSQVPTTAAGYTGTITYSMTANTAGASINSSTGVVTVTKGGSVTVKAIAAAVPGSFSGSEASYTLTVNDTRAALGDKLAWSAASADVTYGADNVFPTLTNTENVDVTYTSSNQAAASIDENTGVITLKDYTGNTIISAIFAGNDDYLAKTVTYTLNVTKAPFAIKDGIFDFVEAATAGEDYGSGISTTTDGNHYETANATWEAGNVTMVTSGKYRWWGNAKDLRFYSNTPKSSFTLSVPSGKVIVKVVLAGGNAFSVSSGTLTSGTWIGAANSVTFEYNAASGSINVSKITVTYTDAKQTFNPAKEYTTLTSAYNLDFTGLSLKAYIATEVSGGAVQMTQVNKVPANTGLVLKATNLGNAVEVPVFDGTEADAVTGNKMAGSATSTTAIAENGGYILKDGVFQPATAGTLAAGKAYLNIAYSASAPVLEMNFNESETTALTLVNSEKRTVNSDIFDLQGRKVAQPTKGLYIVNGKKVVIK